MAEANKVNQITEVVYDLCIERIIENLARYPSGDNSQPFIIVYKSSSRVIEIIHDYTIAQHELNPRNLTSVITLGMIHQMMELMAKEFTFTFKSQSKIGKLNFELKETQCWMEFSDLHFTRPIHEDFFSQVKTNRGEYTNRALGAIDLVEDVYLTNKLEKDLINEISLAAFFFGENKKVVKDVLKWIHFSPNEYRRLASGFYFKEVNINFFEIPIIFLLKIKVILMLFPLGIIRFFFSQKITKIHAATENYLVFVGDYKDANSLYELGKKVYRLKFQLASRGITSHPLSLLTFPHLFHENFGTEKLFTYDFNRIQTIFQDKIKSRKRISWILRVGYPKVDLQISRRRTYQFESITQPSCESSIVSKE